ncbi:ParB-like nuclease domain protein [Aquisphaera giovannonii]|uniref:ParB-like nuclease domain protein n=2 Tax=Aquisphaera giovannonii TaxID=406548 RepID=A0A5B9W7D2_9BACT|nr:ParB-like nuclease domain protein [Aquisphaera giovannonii]
MSKALATALTAFMIAVNKLIVDAPNLRSDYSDQDRLRALWRSFKNDPVHPIVVNAKMEVIDGKSRIVGAILEGDGEFEVPCIVRDDDDPVKTALSQFATAIHRADLPLIDRINAMKLFRDNSPGKPLKEIAKDLQIDETMPSKLLTFERCVPEVQEAIRAGKIGLRDMLEIAKQEKGDQPVLLATKLGGATADKLHEVGKKLRKKADTPAVRVSKIKCPLPSGVVVTVSGDSLSLDDMIETLAEVMKMAKRARDQNLDSKTAARVWADMAAAG